jgi:hypothetical protein
MWNAVARLLGIAMHDHVIVDQDGHARLTRKRLIQGRRRLGKNGPDCEVARTTPMPREHDPEKWVPVFGKDHAPTIT